MIDQEVSDLVEASYERTKKILSENKDKLVKLAEALLEKEVIFKENLVEIFGKRKWDVEEPAKEDKKKESDTTSETSRKEIKADSTPDSEDNSKLEEEKPTKDGSEVSNSQPKDLPQS